MEQEREDQPKIEALIHQLKNWQRLSAFLPQTDCDRDDAKVIAEKIEALESEKTMFVECLEAIRDYEPKEKEICIDEFAYDRLIEAYKEAARNALARMKEG